MVARQGRSVEPREGTPDIDCGVNEVVLVGRLAAPPQVRGMPSGDEVVTFRLIIDRPPADRGPSGRVRVDTIDCVTWRAGIARRVLGYPPDTTVEVRGALRRRFWRGSSGGAASRVEVEAVQVRRAGMPR